MAEPDFFPIERVKIHLGGRGHQSCAPSMHTGAPSFGGRSRRTVGESQRSNAKGRCSVCNCLRGVDCGGCNNQEVSQKSFRKGRFKQFGGIWRQRGGRRLGEDVAASSAKNSRRGYAFRCSGKQSRSRSSRYPLLEQQERKSTPSSPLDALLQQNMSKPLDPGTLSALVQMELLKELRNKGERKEHRDKDPDHSQDSSSSDSSVVGDLKPRGAGKALQAYRQTKKEMKRRPEKHIKRYIRDAEEVLGVTKGIPYRLTDFTQKLNWGKQRTLHRVHYALSSILELQLQGKTMQSTLLMTQVLRSIHQCSLDQGDWRTAWLLTHLPDPMLRPSFWRRGAKFGGDRSLHQSNARPGEEGSIQRCRSRCGRSSCRQGQERKREKRKEGRRRSRKLSSEACPTFFEQLGLLPHGGSLFDLISLQHGSFSRYWKIHTRSYIGTGARTPSHTTRNTT